MASDDNWASQGLSPEAREAGREAARRQGITFEQWLQNAILESAGRDKGRSGQAESRAAERWRSPEASRGRDDDAVGAVRALSDRMEDLRGQLDRLTHGSTDTAIPSSRIAASSGHELAAALQVIEDRLAGLAPDARVVMRERLNTDAFDWNDAGHRTPESDSDISELDRRIAAVDQALNNINGDAAGAPSAQSAPAKPKGDFALGLDRAVADIRERQRILDAADNADAIQRQFVGLSHRLSGGALRPGTPPPAAVDVKDQLRQITEELQSWRRSGSVQDALLVLREELSEIGSKLNEAAPRRALDALEAELHALAARLDDNRVHGTDSRALANIEQGLAEVRGSLRQYAPAEALAAFRDEVRALDRKLEWVEANADGGNLKQFQQSVAELREVASHAASGDALIALAEEVQRIADKLDHVTNPALGSELLSSLDRRFEALAAELGARAELSTGARSDAADNLVAIVDSLAAKIEHLELGQEGSAALDAITGQIRRLTDRIGSADARLDHLEQMDRTFSELLDRVDSLRADSVAAAERAAHDVAMQVVREAAGFDGEALRQDLDALRESHSRSERHTQDTLEVVHDTLERLIDRLAAVETDMRVPLAPSAPTGFNEPPRESLYGPTGPERPSPEPFAQSALTVAESTRPAPPVTLGPTKPAPERRPIDPSLPADHPLEPGAVRPGRPLSSAAERIAASEAALGPARPAAEPDARSNFIAAARRAAQAAANMSPAPEKETAAGANPESSTPASLLRRLTGRRSLMLGFALLIATGGVYAAVKVPALDTKPARAWVLNRVERLASAVAPALSSTKVVAVQRPVKAQPPASPSESEPQTRRADAVASAAPVESALLAAEQSDAVAKPSASAESTGAAASPREAASVSPFTIATMQQPKAADVTGAIGRATGLPDRSGEAGAAVPLASAPLLNAPLGVGIPLGLQSAASNGNAAAAFEVASRYAEGRGVAANLQEAARWFEQAANHELAPAQYRLGSLYEKGQGVKKDLDQARRLYRLAANQGNGKAMHNLAVLYSEGIDGKPDFAAAADWFEKAAAHGVADSQYNLAILYARGLGVEQNFANSYKWFAIAAQRGDADAGRKRDEVIAKLNPEAVEAAQQAVKSFKAEPQPEGAVIVKAPPGGWDSLIPTAATEKPKVGHGSRRKAGSL